MDLGSAQERDPVGAVVLVMGDDPLPRSHRNRPEGGIPRRGGMFHTSNLGDPDRQEPSDGGRDLNLSIASCSGRFVPADHRCEMQMLHLPIEDALVGERRTRMVQMNQFVSTPWGCVTDGLDLAGAERCCHSPSMPQRATNDAACQTSVTWSAGVRFPYSS